MKFYLNDEGDRSVGIFPLEAEFSFDVESLDEKEIEQIKKDFAFMLESYTCGKVRVLTEQELNEQNDKERIFEIGLYIDYLLETKKKSKKREKEIKKLKKELYNLLHKENDTKRGLEVSHKTSFSK